MNDGGYLVGRGIADITGEAAEVGMFGYSMPQQRTAGIHLRLRARAFVVVDPASGRRVGIVNADLGAVMQAVQQGVVRALARRFGDLYTERNLLLAATHTHAGPGGYSHYALYNLAILGFQERTYRAIVDGIVEAIGRAHEDLAPGTITLGHGELTNASENRSRVAFERNPEAEKALFPRAIDPHMWVLGFSQGGRPVGALSWFPTHGTSMTNRNRLISGDNKGYAAWAWERLRAGVRYRERGPGFVAAFGQTNAGDMSPNLNLRPGSGPTEDEVENTRIIGERQLCAAVDILAGATSMLAGEVDYRMRYVDMSRVVVEPRFAPDGREHATCPAAIGLSTLAGSREDGPGLPIREGRSGVVGTIGSLWLGPRPGIIGCQLPKQVVVPTGLMRPSPWTPEVLPLQILRIGQLYLVGVPGEFTIVSGHRVRRTVAAELGAAPEHVVLVGYANAYSQYVTTPEEYEAQHYEGGSTLFGRWTLPAYQQELARIARALRDGEPVSDAARPRDLSDRQRSFQPGVVFDTALGRNFGDVVEEPCDSYRRGETVTVVFWTGHPKNDLRRGGTFLEVQRRSGNDWVAEADDGDWETTYRWKRWLVAASQAIITWTIPARTEPGSYRLVHRGDWKHWWTGRVSPFEGVSRAFTVTE